MHVSVAAVATALALCARPRRARTRLAGAAAAARRGALPSPAALAPFLLVKRRRAPGRCAARWPRTRQAASALATALGDLHVAESRIAHPDQSLVGDIEQLRIVTREHALSSRRLAQLEESELRAAERGATLAAILGTDDPERLAGELETAQRNDAQAIAARERVAELEPRASAAGERVQQSPSA